MKIRFWGVRGSLPNPLTPAQVQQKISAVVERMSVKDAECAESKMKFLASLPEWIYGTVGGNTPCVQLTSKKGCEFIFDLGSGIKSFCSSGLNKNVKHYNIFLSHFHWDHIQGLPFFDDIYNSDKTFDIYSGFDNGEEFLCKQSSLPFFPENACWDKIKNRFTFHKLVPGEIVKVDGLSVECLEMNHPGSSFAYSVQEGNKKVIYATDVELKSQDYVHDESRNRFFSNTDVLIIDSQYTFPDAVIKENWGHSSFAAVVDFAQVWNANNVYLFHHEPCYDDRKLYQILQCANWYAEYRNCGSLKLNLAVEGQEFEV